MKPRRFFFVSPITSGFLKKAIGGVVVLAFLWTNTGGLYAGENAFWRERREASRKFSSQGRDQKTALSLSAEARQMASVVPEATAVPMGKLVPSALSQKGLKDPSSNNWINAILPYGDVGEVYVSPKAGSPMVIHVQDAHGIEEAQKNISALLGVLKETRGASLVGLEGASGTFTLTPFRQHPHEIVQDVSDFILTKGLIGGPEYAGLTLPHPPTLFGVEDGPLYLKNVAVLKEAYKTRPQVRDILKTFQSSTNKLKETVYSKPLQDYDRHAKAYESGQENLGTWVRYLTQVYKGNNALHTGSPIRKGGGGFASSGHWGVPRLFYFPNIHHLLNALDLEDSLDFKQVEADRLNLVNTLVKVLPKPELDALVARSVDHRSGRMGYGEYHRALKEQCEKNGIRLERYGQLGPYINYVLVAESINRKDLLDEIGILEEKAQTCLIETKDQEKLATISRRLALLDKLIHHEMTMTDWTRFQKERSLSVSVNLSDVLQLKEDLTNLNPALATIPPLSDADLKPFEDFCSIAVARNNSLVSHLLTKMKTEDTPTAVLMAGGFHTEGITSLLRAKEISYAVVMPKISKIPEHSDYLDVLAKDPVPLEQQLAGEKIYLVHAAQTADNGLGEDIRPFLTVFFSDLRKLWDRGTFSLAIISPTANHVAERLAQNHRSVRGRVTGYWRDHGGMTKAWTVLSDGFKSLPQYAAESLYQVPWLMAGIAVHVTGLPLWIGIPLVATVFLTFLWRFAQAHRWANPAEKREILWGGLVLSLIIGALFFLLQGGMPDVKILNNAQSFTWAFALLTALHAAYTQQILYSQRAVAAGSHSPFHRWFSERSFLTIDGWSGTKFNLSTIKHKWDKDLVQGILDHKSGKYVKASLTTIFPKTADWSISEISISRHDGTGGKIFFQFDFTFNNQETRSVMFVMNKMESSGLAGKYEKISKKDSGNEYTPRYGQSTDDVMLSSDAPPSVKLWDYTVFSYEFVRGDTLDQYISAIDFLVGDPRYEGEPAPSLRTTINQDRINAELNFLLRSGLINRDELAELSDVIASKRSGTSNVRWDFWVTRLRKMIVLLDGEAIKAQAKFSAKTGFVQGDPRRQNIVLVSQKGTRTYKLIDFERMSDYAQRMTGEPPVEFLWDFDVYEEKDIPGVLRGNSVRPWFWTFQADKTGFFDAVKLALGDSGLPYLRRVYSHHGTSSDLRKHLGKYLERFPPPLIEISSRGGLYKINLMSVLSPRYLERKGWSKSRVFWTVVAVIPIMETLLLGLLSLSGVWGIWIPQAAAQWAPLLSLDPMGTWVALGVGVVLAVALSWVIGWMFSWIHSWLWGLQGQEVTDKDRKNWARGGLAFSLPFTAVVFGVISGGFWIVFSIAALMSFSMHALLNGLILRAKRKGEQGQILHAWEKTLAGMNVFSLVGASPSKGSHLIPGNQEAFARAKEITLGRFSLKNDGDPLTSTRTTPTRRGDAIDVFRWKVDQWGTPIRHSLSISQRRTPDTPGSTTTDRIYDGPLHPLEVALIAAVSGAPVSNGQVSLTLADLMLFLNTVILGSLTDNSPIDEKPTPETISSAHNSARLMAGLSSRKALQTAMESLMDQRWDSDDFEYLKRVYRYGPRETLPRIVREMALTAVVQGIKNGNLSGDLALNLDSVTISEKIVRTGVWEMDGNQAVIQAFLEQSQTSQPITPNRNANTFLQAIPPHELLRLYEEYLKHKEHLDLAHYLPFVKDGADDYRQRLGVDSFTDEVYRHLPVAAGLAYANIHRPTIATSNSFIFQGEMVPFDEVIEGIQTGKFLLVIPPRSTGFSLQRNKPEKNQSDSLETLEGRALHQLTREEIPSLIVKAWHNQEMTWRQLLQREGISPESVKSFTPTRQHRLLSNQNAIDMIHFLLGNELVVRDIAIRMIASFNPGSHINEIAQQFQKSLDESGEITSANPIQFIRDDISDEDRDLFQALWDNANACYLLTEKMLELASERRQGMAVGTMRFLTSLRLPVSVKSVSLMEGIPTAVATQVLFFSPAVVGFLLSWMLGVAPLSWVGFVGFLLSNGNGLWLGVAGVGLAFVGTWEGLYQLHLKTGVVNALTMKANKSPTLQEVRAATRTAMVSFWGALPGTVVLGLLALYGTFAGAVWLGVGIFVANGILAGYLHLWANEEIVVQRRFNRFFAVPENRQAFETVCPQTAEALIKDALTSRPPVALRFFLLHPLNAEARQKASWRKAVARDLEERTRTVTDWVKLFNAMPSAGALGMVSSDRLEQVGMVLDVARLNEMKEDERNWRVAYQLSRLARGRAGEGGGFRLVVTDFSGTSNDRAAVLARVKNLSVDLHEALLSADSIKGLVSVVPSNDLPRTMDKTRVDLPALFSKVGISPTELTSVELLADPQKVLTGLLTHLVVEVNSFMVSHLIDQSLRALMEMKQSA